MQQGSVILSNIKNNKAIVINKNSSSKLGYVIFIVKLLEKLILISYEHGETIRNIAF